MQAVIDDFEKTITLYLRADTIEEDVALAKIASGLDREKNPRVLFQDTNGRVNLQIDFTKGF